MNENIKILILDDDPDVLFATSRIVKSEGYQVFNASTGSECKELAKKEHPDLILMDVVLPDIPGTELCKQIKRDPELKDIFVVMISGIKTASDNQADGLDVGADGYIARPISNRELKARVHAMVRILSAERERDRLILELKEALSRIKTLEGIIPICMYCHKIRDSTDTWQKLEAYISKHSDAQFSHSICPDCMQEHYPEALEDK